MLRQEKKKETKLLDVGGLHAASRSLVLKLQSSSSNSLPLSIARAFFRSITPRFEPADALISTGLSKLGYTYVNIDDCWGEFAHDDKGDLVPKKSTFPSGIKALANYVHSKGLKLGIYSDAGKTMPGSLGHEEQDAKTFAAWIMHDGKEQFEKDFFIKTHEKKDGSWVDSATEDLMAKYDEANLQRMGLHVSMRMGFFLEVLVSVKYNRLQHYVATQMATQREKIESIKVQMNEEMNAKMEERLNEVTARYEAKYDVMQAQNDEMKIKYDAMQEMLNMFMSHMSGV